MSTKGALAFEVITEFVLGKLSRGQASELLQLTERSASRMARRIKAKGLLGTVHGNRGRKPWNQKSPGLKAEIMTAIKKSYFDCKLTHAKELLEANHGITINHETLRR